MSKRRSLAKLSSIDSRFLTERSQGEGAAYKPWLLVQDLPSLGRVHRVKGWKHGRVHHLLSDLEARVFFIYEWSLQIIDIREQYPLLPLDETLAISSMKQFGYHYSSHSANVWRDGARRTRYR